MLLMDPLLLHGCASSSQNHRTYLPLAAVRCCWLPLMISFDVACDAGVCAPVWKAVPLSKELAAVRSRSSEHSAARNV